LSAPLTSILATLSQQSGKIACSPEKKPFSNTGIGEHPDLHDGVRTNIRPLINANLLHKTSNIKWTKGHGRGAKLGLGRIPMVLERQSVRAGSRERCPPDECPEEEVDGA
jgi:hypothetical protein